MTAAPSQRGDRGDRREAAGPRERSLGVVLCGGHSRRMGSDKGALRLADGRTLVGRAADVLRGLTDAVVLASGRPPRYPAEGLPEIGDARPGAGPLAGLEAALAEASERGCVRAAVVACDMPRVDARLVGALLARSRDEDLDVVLVRTERGVEPLLGVYAARCLPAVRRALDAGERRMVAFHADSVEGRPLRVRALDPGELGAGPEAARNLNTPAELERELLERPLPPGEGRESGPR